MTSTNFSPGPWTFIEGDPDDGAIYVQMDDSRDVYIANMEGSDYIDHANGRLITAAPDLLDALTALLDYVENDNPGAAAGDAWVSLLCSNARAAITKTRGDA